MIKRRDPFDEFAFLIRKETATSLGLSGKALQKALDDLAAFDVVPGGRPYQSRHKLVQAACDALHGYLVQKELNGISDNETLKKAFHIPEEIWRKLGFVVDEKDSE
jgi:hypothetical protein